MDINWMIDDIEDKLTQQYNDGLLTDEQYNKLINYYEELRD